MTKRKTTKRATPKQAAARRAFAAKAKKAGNLVKTGKAKNMKAAWKQVK